MIVPTQPKIARQQTNHPRTVPHNHHMHRYQTPLGNTSLSSPTKLGLGAGFGTFLGLTIGGASKRHGPAVCGVMSAANSSKPSSAGLDPSLVQLTTTPIHRNRSRPTHLAMGRQLPDLWPITGRVAQHDPRESATGQAVTASCQRRRYRRPRGKRDPVVSELSRPHPQSRRTTLSDVASPTPHRTPPRLERTLPRVLRRATAHPRRSGTPLWR